MKFLSESKDKHPASASLGDDELLIKLGSVSTQTTGSRDWPCNDGGVAPFNRQEFLFPPC